MRGGRKGDGEESRGDESWKVERVCDGRGVNVSYGTGSHVS